MSKRNRLCIAAIFLTLSILVLCTACNQESMESPGKNAADKSGVPSNSEQPGSAGTYKARLSEKLIVDAVVDAPDIKEAAILTVDDARFDVQSLCDTFLGSNNVKREKISDVETCYLAGDKKLYIVQGQYFRFETLLGIYADNVVGNGQNQGTSQETDRFKLSGLDFMPRQKAVEKAEEILKSIDITPHMPPQVYSLDCNSLEQEQEKLLKDKDFKYFVDIGKVKLKDTWTKDDECYYMIFKTDFHGIPCDTAGYTMQSNQIDISGNSITIIYSKNGIQLFRTNGVLYHEKESRADTSKLITIERALNSLKEKYSDIILKDELKITNISLVYEPTLINASHDQKTGGLSNKQMELVPAWIFITEQKYTKGGTSNTVYNAVRIDAITGKEIQ